VPMRRPAGAGRRTRTGRPEPAGAPPHVSQG